MVLEKHIEELLYHHDCVIIPGFGGFIGSYSPARIRTSNNQFFPPSKSLLFNVKLHHNDGLLANFISENEGLGYEESMNLIRQETGVWKKVLEENRRLVMGRVGELHLEPEGNIIFRQSPFINFLPDAFGLSSFVSASVERNDEIPEEITYSTTGRTAGYLKWAAALALPIGIAAYMGFHQYDRIREFSASYSGIFFSSSPEAKTKLPARKTFVIPAPHKSPFQISEEKFQVNINDRYAIIVGAFRIPENAQNLISALKNKGISASVYDVTRSGLTRVTIGTYADRETAIKQLDLARANHPAAWLLSK